MTHPVSFVTGQTRKAIKATVTLRDAQICRVLSLSCRRLSKTWLNHTPVLPPRLDIYHFTTTKWSYKHLKTLKNDTIFSFFSLADLFQDFQKKADRRVHFDGVQKGMKPKQRYFSSGLPWHSPGTISSSTALLGAKQRQNMF